MDPPRRLRPRAVLASPAAAGRGSASLAAPRRRSTLPDTPRRRSTSPSSTRRPWPLRIRLAGRAPSWTASSSTRRPGRSRRCLHGPTTTCARDCVAERGDAYLRSASSRMQNGSSDCVVCWSVCFVGKSTVCDLFCVWVALWVLCWRQYKAKAA